MKHNLTNIIKRKWSAIVLLCAMIAVSNTAWGTTYYLLGGTSDNPASWSTLASNTSYSFTVDLVQYNNYVGISTSESVANLIAISDSYTFMDASSLTYHFQYKEWGGYKYVNIDTKAAGKYTITFNGTNTYTITAAAASYTISTSGSNCTFSPTSRSIASGSSNTFTVTPASGYKLVSASVTNATCDPTNLNNAIAATTITVSNPTAAGTLTVVTAPATSTSVPTVRIGSQIEEEADYDVHLGGYVAATGCSNISKFTIYYSKSTITSKSGSGVFKKDISASSPAVGSNTPLTLPSSDISSHSWGNANMYVRITATNGVGESELSDEVVLAYTLCDGVITELTISPASTTLEINKAQTFSYTANTGAVVNSVKWYKNNAEVSTSSTYTFTPNTTDDFTIGLKAVNTSCNPAPGFAAETQTYHVCSPITGVTITDCPASNVAIGTPVTLHATITGAASADNWEWRVNDAAQEVTASGTSASITFTPREAKTYYSELTVTDCVGVEHSTECSFNAANTFTANNLTGKSFTACKGNHQFKWSDMFTPEPDSWSVVIKNTSTDAKSLFTLDENGYMVWNPAGKSSGSYSYVFTANKTGYTSQTAELQFTYTANAPSGSVSNITITSGESPTYPYVKIGLSCTVTGSVTSVGWSVDNNGLVVSTGDRTAYFKGKSVKTATSYTVSAAGLSESCGASAAKTITIVVNPEPAESCD